MIPAVSLCFLGPLERVDEEFRAHQRAAEAGVLTSMVFVGVSFYEGTKTSRDVAKAIFWLERAAAQGDTDAMCELGKIFFFEEEPIQDDQRAFSLFRHAAALDHEEALFLLAGIYVTGTPHVNQDLARAQKILERAHALSYTPPIGLLQAYDRAQQAEYDAPAPEERRVRCRYDNV